MSRSIASRCASAIDAFCLELLEALGRVLLPETGVSHLPVGGGAGLLELPKPLLLRLDLCRRVRGLAALSVAAALPPRLDLAPCAPDAKPATISQPVSLMSSVSRPRARASRPRAPSRRCGASRRPGRGSSCSRRARGSLRADFVSPLTALRSDACAASSSVLPPVAMLACWASMILFPASSRRSMSRRSCARAG